MYTGYYDRNAEIVCVDVRTRLESLEKHLETVEKLYIKFPTAHKRNLINSIIEEIDTCRVMIGE